MKNGEEFPPPWWTEIKRPARVLYYNILKMVFQVLKIENANAIRRNHEQINIL